MAYENIIFVVEKDIATISFNRPEALNAVNSPTLIEFSDILDRLEHDDDVRAVIITGSGNKAFVAGADIAEMAHLSPLELRAFSAKAHDLLFRLENLPIPVIACVNGYALGGGSEIALACDFIYASENARIGQPEVTLGLIPGWGGTQRLSRLVGKSMAKELCLTGRVIDAVEAKELGIVNHVFPQETLMDETLKTARKISAMGRITVRAVKQCIDRGFDIDLKTGCALETDAFGYCAATPDGQEGMQAFLEKRNPDFTGKLL